VWPGISALPALIWDLQSVLCLLLPAVSTALSNIALRRAQAKFGFKLAEKELRY
jgi:hypothetical protein